jgi:hypothetical protein
LLDCAGSGRGRTAPLSAQEAAAALMERDGDEARAEQKKARCGQRQKSIGDEIVTTHDTPAVFPMIAGLY